MKKILAWTAGLTVALLTATAFAETAVNGAEITTQIVIWILCGVLTLISTLAAWAVKTYALPWLRQTAIPWLRQHSLLQAAQIAVEYAEAVVGRFNGEEKLKLALAVLGSKGWANSDEVLQALKAKWQELDLAQLAAGVKVALSEEMSATQAKTAGEGADETGSGWQREP